MIGDTIFATSSGAPPAAISVIRISGPSACAIASALVGSLPQPRHAALRSIRDPYSAILLDRALVLIFPGPRTATGEDVVEFHVHGGRAVVSAVEAAITGFPKTRRAEPGEFTRRALENGVIDLTAAEGLADLLAAETETQRRAALRMAEGNLRHLIADWGSRLVDIAARIEAQLDFSDEDDVPDEALASVVGDAMTLIESIDVVLCRPPVERIRDGIRVVIAGPPNSGKSTLLNAMTGRAAAIVSSIAGTTRDRIDAPVIRDGIAYLLTDTAGLTLTPADEVEKMGVVLAESAMLEADLVLWLGDTRSFKPHHINVHARADMPGRIIAPDWCDSSISVKADTGIDALWALIASKAKALLPAEEAIIANRRQRLLLEKCRDEVKAGTSQTDLLIVAEQVRRGLVILDEITGGTKTEDVLNRLFSSFCIGK